MSQKRAEVFSAAVVVIIGLFFIVFSLPIYNVGIGSGPGGGVFPLWVGAVQTLCGLIYLRNSLASSSREKFVELSGQQQRWLWQSALSMIIYIGSMPLVGFAPATFLFVGYHVRILGRHSLRFSAILSAVTTVVCVYFFGVLLYMPLPKGPLGW